MCPKRARVRYDPSWNANNGPAKVGCVPSNWCNAVKGQRAEPVRQRRTDPPPREGICLRRLDAQTRDLAFGVESEIAVLQVYARVKAARRGGAVFCGAQQAKEGGGDRGGEHDSVASREVAANVRTQKNQGGNCDRSPRRPCEAVGLGALEAAQHKPERMHTRHLRREAETEPEMLQPCQVRAEGGHGKARTPEGHKQLQHELLEGERVGDSHLPTKSGTDSALTRKPVTCWQPRSLPAVDVVVLKPLPNVRRNHRRHGQCPACSGPELLHLQPRKHISVNILAARHVRQTQIHVPLGKENEKPAHKRHDVGALTRARRPNLHHRHVVRVQENLCVMH